MNKFKLLFLFALTGLLFITGCKDDEETTIEEVVVVANRASGSVSFVDANTNEILKELSISGSEPMYVVYVTATDRVYVGDRSQNKIHIIDPETQTVVGDVTVGNGVFHMWADGQGSELWVNNDVDNTISVIDLATNTVVQTIDLGIKPHDVFVDNSGTRAYVSIFSGDEMIPDSIYMFNASTYAKTMAVPVGKDPHVFHSANKGQLYVPCQSGSLFVLDESDLSTTTELNLTGAHGIYSSNQEDVFVTNISGAQLYAVNASNNTLVGTPLDTPEATPHNITVNEASSKMFVTHSGGTADKLTVYNLDGGAMTLDATITIGTNPFGLAYYKR